MTNPCVLSLLMQKVIVNCHPLTVDDLNNADGPVALAPCQLLAKKSMLCCLHLVSSNEQKEVVSCAVPCTH